MFSLEWPHRGDFNAYTQYTIFNIKNEISLNYPKSATMGFFQSTQERVRNRRGKRAIGVRATECLLYFQNATLQNLYLVSFFITVSLCDYSYKKMPGKMSLMIRF